MNGTEEEFVPEDEAEEGAAALKKLREKLKKAIEEKQEYLDGWQRARADFANYKRDEMARSANQELRLKIEFADSLIPALDAFDMALASIPQSDTAMRKGIGAVFSNLQKSLERMGIIRFDPAGERFDPYKHEALREVATNDAQEDHLIESVQRAGYLVAAGGGEDRIIRPAQVSVYTFHH